MLDKAQQNQHKLCKKKLKEIDAVRSKIGKDGVKFANLSKQEQDKLKRAPELQQTVQDLETLADDLVRQEEEELEKQRQEAARLAEMETPEYKAREAARLAAEATRKAEEEEEARRRAEEEAKRKAQEEEAARKRAAEEAKRKAEEEAAAAEAARLAAIAAAEAAEAEKQTELKLRKTSIKKLKEIQVLEKKMADRGQTLAEQLPEVQEKLGKKSELEALVEELNRKYGPIE